MLILDHVYLDNGRERTEQTQTTWTKAFPCLNWEKGCTSRGRLSGGDMKIPASRWYRKGLKAKSFSCWIFTSFWHLWIYPVDGLITLVSFPSSRTCLPKCRIYMTQSPFRTYSWIQPSCLPLVVSHLSIQNRQTKLFKGSWKTSKV